MTLLSFVPRIVVRANKKAATTVVCSCTLEVTAASAITCTVYPYEQLDAVFPFEAFHTSTGIDELLFACKERMTVGANVHLQVLSR